MVGVLESEFVGKTFDDFLFRPQKGVAGSRRELRLTSPLTRHLNLELPVISANMDSVTGGAMAKTMALEGGIGFVHRAMTIEAQADEVRRVKRSYGYVVEQPFSLPRTATLAEAREIIRLHNVSMLIEESAGSGIIAGLLSARDIPWFPDDEGRTVDEFMTPIERLHTGPPDVSLEQAERILYEHRIEKLPLIDRSRRIHGLITKKDIILHQQRPHVSKDGKGRLRVGAAIGARGDFLDRTEALIEAGVDVLVIDIAHGHSEVMEQAMKQFRDRFSDKEVICGNAGTAEGAIFLKDLGADAIKVGIGPGRGCRTRLETAAGVPQLQAIREAWCAVGEEVPIIADGGVRQDKDIFLALACGASTVMMGSALSGTTESPGTVIVDPASGDRKKIYRGMTSPQAVLGALYSSDEEDIDEALATPAEGQEIQIPFRGSVVDILHRIRGHLRSAVSYAGERTLTEARSKIVNDPFQYLIPLSEPSRRESYDR
jgi:IMP dehydrogenase